MEDRLCICNMAIEAGAKNGIFPVDEITEAYLKGRSQRPWVKYEADPDAEYERTVTIDLTALEPTVSYPHLPENTHLAKEGKDIKIDQVVIGSCTNGRIEDMQAAYEVLKGKHIAKGVRGIIIPATHGRVQGVHPARTTLRRSSMQAASSPPPPAAPAWAATWAFLAAGERCCLHHQPQLCGPHGPRGLRGLPGQPRHRRSQRTDRLHHRSEGGLSHERKRTCF